MDKPTLANSTLKHSHNTLELSGTERLEKLTKQITIVSSMISGKAPSPFCETYAEDLLESFPDVPISEIFAAMKRGAKGEFGPVYLLNGTVLYDWVKRHSDENNPAKMTPEQKAGKTINGVKYNSVGDPIV